MLRSNRIVHVFLAAGHASAAISDKTRANEQGSAGAAAPRSLPSAMRNVHSAATQRLLRYRNCLLRWS